jgi:tetratricopeptide (TPR) repeat protein
MSQPTKQNDGKLLFAIAGGIIVIAAAIAVLASLGNQADSAQQRVAAMPAVRSETVEPVVFPASNGTTSTEIAESLVDQLDESNVQAPSFTVDPEANFIQQGTAAYESRRFEEAVAYFSAEAQARSERAWTHYILALSQWKAGSTEDASDSMRRSLEIDSNQVKAQLNLARIENDRAEFDAALTAVDAALVMEPENAEAFFMRARSLYNMGDKETALTALEASLERDIENGYAHNLVGLIWIERGEANQALTAMEQAAERVPEVSFVQNNLGMALELSDRLDEAAVAYARALDLSPDHQHAALNLARLDGRIPEFPEETVDEQPVVAVLTETDSTVEETPLVGTVTDESEIPD